MIYKWNEQLNSTLIKKIEESIREMKISYDEKYLYFVSRSGKIYCIDLKENKDLYNIDASASKICLSEIDNEKIERDFQYLELKFSLLSSKNEYFIAFIIFY